MKREADQAVDALENEQNSSPNQRQKKETGEETTVLPNGTTERNGGGEDVDKKFSQEVVDGQENDVDEENENENAAAVDEGGKRLPPKCRIAMIVGYNGSDFCGSQKNPNVRTVEGEIEKALFEMGCINKLNFGDLKRIAWNRATRTDKSVHALQNTFSCKVHIDKAEREADVGMESFRMRLNKELKKITDAHTSADKVPMKDGEIKVFCVIEVSNRFNSKN